MVDKIKPLKIESASTGGTEDDMFPHESDPTEDYLAAKGVAFENLDTTRIYGDSGTLMFQDNIETTPVTLEDLRSGQGTAVGRLFDRRFFNGGATANKWLTQFFTSTPTDQVPVFIPFDFECYGVTFGNKNTNVYCDVEIYKNGIVNPTNLIFTLEVRGYQFFRNTTTSNHFSGNVGNTLAIYVKQVAGGNNAADTFVDLFFRITSDTVGTGGS